MKMIALSDNILVDPSKIVAITGKMGAGKKQIQVTMVGGAKYFTSKNPKELMDEMEVTPTSKYETSWAG